MFKSKEEKAAQKEAKFQKELESYGLNGYVGEEEMQMVKMLIAKQAGDGLLNFAAIMNPNEKTSLQILTQQNQVIMEQNKLMIHFLAKIANKGE